jgi:hypothetical protein
MGEDSDSLLFEICLKDYAAAGGITPPKLVHVTALIREFIAGAPLDECRARSFELSGRTDPIDHLNQILTITREPFPDDRPPASARDPVQRWGMIRPWKADEDARLIAGIFRFGIGNWSSIATFVGNRSRPQCSVRWRRSLNPRLSRAEWTEDENRMLLSHVRKFGERSWTQIARQMGDRSDIQCEYQYRRIRGEPRRKPAVRTARWASSPPVAAPFPIFPWGFVSWLPPPPERVVQFRPFGMTDSLPIRPPVVCEAAVVEPVLTREERNRLLEEHLFDSDVEGEGEPDEADCAAPPHFC